MDYEKKIGNCDSADSGLWKINGNYDSAKCFLYIEMTDFMSSKIILNVVYILSNTLVSASSTGRFVRDYNKSGTCIYRKLDVLFYYCSECLAFATYFVVDD